MDNPVRTLPVHFSLRDHADDRRGRLPAAPGPGEAEEKGHREQLAGQLALLQDQVHEQPGRGQGEGGRRAGRSGELIPQ